MSSSCVFGAKLGKGLGVLAFFLFFKPHTHKLYTLKLCVLHMYMQQAKLDFVYTASSLK